MTKLKIIATLVVVYFFFILKDNIISNEKYSSILQITLSISGILIAIITTFIFSKILTERNERINLKYRIDEFSIKINSLRKISKILTSSSNFWINNCRNIFHEYPNIDLFTLREFNYDQHTDFINITHTSDLTSQAFLGLHIIQGDDIDQLSLHYTYRKNYQIEELYKYQDCCSQMFAYTEEYHNRVSFEEWATTDILNEFRKFEYPVAVVTGKSIGSLFDDFNTKYIPNLIKLTSKSRESIGQIYNWIFVDMVFALLILSISIIGLTFCTLPNDVVIAIVLSIILVMFDIVLNTFQSLKTEIQIKEFYK
jgi:hypothetical protein